MGAAAPASTNSTFYCELPIFSRLQYVIHFHLCVGTLLSSCGVLICTFLIWVAIKKWFSNVCKCVNYTFTSILAVLVIVVVLSFLIAMGILLFNVFSVLDNFSSISDYHCNTGFLVMYYWAFADTVVIPLVIGFAISVGIFVIFCVIVKCLTKCS